MTETLELSDRDFKVDITKMLHKQLQTCLEQKKKNRKGKERNRNSHPKTRRHQEKTNKNFGTKKIKIK